MKSARRRLFEGHADVRKGLPSNAAFSERPAGIEGKVEFGGKARSAWKMQAGATIGQIANDTIESHATGRNDFGALEYFGPRKPPMLNHTQRPSLLFDKKTVVRICFKIGNKIVRIILMCGNPNDTTRKRNAARYLALGALFGEGLRSADLD